MSGFLSVWRILFVGRWWPLLCVCDVETLIGPDTIPTRVDSDTRRVSFRGESSDAISQYGGAIYIVANLVIVSPIGLFSTCATRSARRSLVANYFRL